MIPETLREEIERTLACPYCGGGLVAGDDDARCERCDRSFPIREGVLDFLSPPAHEGEP